MDLSLNVPGVTVFHLLNSDITTAAEDSQISVAILQESL